MGLRNRRSRRLVVFVEMSGSEWRSTAPDTLGSSTKMWHSRSHILELAHNCDQPERRKIVCTVCEDTVKEALSGLCASTIALDMIKGMKSYYS
jgi:hypothetical protein